MLLAASAAAATAVASLRRRSRRITYTIVYILVLLVLFIVSRAPVGGRPAGSSRPARPGVPACVPASQLPCKPDMHPTRPIVCSTNRTSNYYGVQCAPCVSRHSRVLSVNMGRRRPRTPCSPRLISPPRSHNTLSMLEKGTAGRSTVWYPYPSATPTAFTHGQHKVPLH